MCPHCHNGQCPADAALDIEKTDLSPGVRRMLALVGAEAPFDHGRKQIQLLAGLAVTAKAVERTAEAVPILLCGDGRNQHPCSEGGNRGPRGQSEGPARAYPRGQVAAIETAGEFGPRLYLEAWNRGWERAEKKVVIANGAEWIWNNAAAHFPGAIQIVDIFHARQHLWDVARKLYPGQDAEQKCWIAIHQKLLEKIRAEADYVDNNKERMRYPKFRAQHLFIGSGFIEAGCKTIIGSRCQPVWHVLDSSRRKRHPGAPLRPLQRPV
jgi:hypothetical protein